MALSAVNGALAGADGSPHSDALGWGHSSLGQALRVLRYPDPRALPQHCHFYNSALLQNSVTVTKNTWGWVGTLKERTVWGPRHSWSRLTSTRGQNHGLPWSL